MSGIFLLDLHCVEDEGCVEKRVKATELEILLETNVLNFLNFDKSKIFLEAKFNLKLERRKI